MLLKFNRLRDLNFSSLMEVYEEGNRENGDDRWPDEPKARRLQLAEEDFWDYLHTFFSAPGAAYFVWQENARYVSALRMEPYRDGWLLEALETVPARRREGYAALLTRAVLSAEPWGRVYSHVHKKNTASLLLHEVCGFRRISEEAVMINGSVNPRCCTLLYEEECE